MAATTRLLESKEKSLSSCGFFIPPLYENSSILTTISSSLDALSLAEFIKAYYPVTTKKFRDVQLTSLMTQTIEKAKRVWSNIDIPDPVDEAKRERENPVTLLEIFDSVVMKLQMQTQRDFVEVFFASFKGIGEYPIIPEIIQRMPLPQQVEGIENWIKKYPDHEVFQQDSLDLAGLELRTLPINFLRLFRNLRSLNLSINKLQTLPSGIGLLTSLKSLDISYNELTSLPDSIGSLINLNNLSLSKNHLQDLPVEFSNLLGLSTLKLSENNFRVFPKIICLLNGLTDLDCSNNHLTILPSEFSLLNNLYALALDNNKLEYLPDHFCSLEKINFLFLFNNNLKTLPDGFDHFIDHLEELEMDRNPNLVISDELRNLISERFLI